MFNPKYKYTKIIVDNIGRIRELVVSFNEKYFPNTVLVNLERDARALSTFSSTSIEGNPLPLTDVKKILKTRPENIKDTQREIINYNDALEIVEKMTVLELADLVKVMEDKFGVSTTAPVAMAATSAVAPEGETEEKSVFNVVLKDAGSEKIAVIKAIREISEMGLKEAKELVDNAPQTIKEEVAKEEAEEMKKKLEEAGAKVELE